MRPLALEPRTLSGPCNRNTVMCQPTQAADDARHEAPRALALLAAGPDPAYDDLVRLAAQVCGTPMALLALLDQHHIRLIARLGVDADQVPREGSLCARTAAAGDLLVVTNADAGPACAEQSLVTGAERVRFFAAGAAAHNARAVGRRAGGA